MRLPLKLREKVKRTETIQFDGGLNEQFDTLELEGGELILGENYNMLVGTQKGYRSVAGYERYDGRTAPSSIAASAGNDTARENARTAITKPGGTTAGSGPVRGIWMYRDKLYAFRDDLSGTYCKMWVATTGGWVEIDTSNAPMLAGGKFKFVNHNFYGQPSTERMYWVDGVNRCRVFDGGTVQEIINEGMSATPSDSPSDSPSEGTPSDTPSDTPSEGTPSESPSDGTPSDTPSGSPSEGTPSTSPSEGTPSGGTPSGSPSEGTPSGQYSEALFLAEGGDTTVVGVGGTVNVRVVIPASELDGVSGRCRLRFAYSGAITTRVVSMYLWKQASSGDAYDGEAGTAVQVTVGGSGTFDIDGPDIYSDYLDFDINGSENIVLAVALGATLYTFQNTSHSNVDWYYKSTADETSTADVSSYSAGSTDHVAFLEYILGDVESTPSEGTPSSSPYLYYPLTYNPLDSQPAYWDETGAPAYSAGSHTEFTASETGNYLSTQDGVLDINDKVWSKFCVDQDGLTVEYGEAVNVLWLTGSDTGNVGVSFYNASGNYRVYLYSGSTQDFYSMSGISGKVWFWLESTGGTGSDAVANLWMNTSSGDFSGATLICSITNGTVVGDLDSINIGCITTQGTPYGSVDIYELSVTTYLDGTPSTSPSTSPSEGTPSATPSHSPSTSPSGSPSEGTPSTSPSSSPSEGTPSHSPSSSFEAPDEGDIPVAVAAHNDRLWLGYYGGSLQASTVGEPTDFVTDAEEIGVGKEIVDLVPGVENTLTIFCRDAIYLLKGTAATTTWQLERYSDEVGAFEFTAVSLLGTLYFASDRGVTNLEAVDAFGNLRANTISDKVFKTYSSKKSKITTAVVSKDKNQYRLFFNDGYGIFFSFMGNELRGATLVNFDHVVRIAASVSDTNGNNYVFFGDPDGMVYKMDSGTSFDGGTIDTILQTPYYHYKTPRFWKKFIEAVFEISCDSSIDINLNRYYNYSLEDVPDSAEYVFTLTEGNVTNLLYALLKCLAFNMSFEISSSSKYAEQHTVHNASVDYELLNRRL